MGSEDQGIRDPGPNFKDFCVLRAWMVSSLFIFIIFNLFHFCAWTCACRYEFVSTTAHKWRLEETCESWFSFHSVGLRDPTQVCRYLYLLSHFFSNPKLCNLKTTIKRQNCTFLSINVGVWDLIKCRFVGLNETFRIRNRSSRTVVLDCFFYPLVPRFQMWVYCMQPTL